MVNILSIKTRDELLESIGVTNKNYNSEAYNNEVFFEDSIEDDINLFAFFGDPAVHSLSPKMYNNAFSKLGMNGLYFASQVPEGFIRDAMYKVRKLGIKGVNISKPHKLSVINELYEVDEMVELCEAVNTVIWENGDLKGYNTDWVGSVRAIRELLSLKESETSDNNDKDKDKDKDIDIDILSKPLGKIIDDAVVLGLGGAGKAVIVGLAKEGVREINIFVRRNKPIEYSKYITKVCNAFPGIKISINTLNNKNELKRVLQDSKLLINTTNVGMGELEGESLIQDTTFLHPELNVMDIIYAPEKTKLLEQAEETGCTYINGLPMLLHQGEEAFKLYTGIETKLNI